jgi:hypothetical protein
LPSGSTRFARWRGSRLSQELDDLARPGVSTRFRLLEHRRAIAMDLESSAARRQQLNVRIRPLGVKLGRQTDGPWFVVSKRAVFDRDRHSVPR